MTPEENRLASPMRPAPAYSWRGIAICLAIAYGLSWAAQIALSLIARGDDPSLLAAVGGASLIVAAALMWPPAIGAFVARRWIERTFAGAGLRLPAWRYLLIAWFGPALVTLGALLISLPIYPFDTQFTAFRQALERTGQPLPMPPATLVAIQIVSALTVGPVINAIFAFGEEFGWRGYLMPALMARLGAWPGLLLHGAIWGFWHAPLIWLTGYNYPSQPQLGVLLFTIFGAIAGVLFGWLQLASRSVWAPTIAHGAFNAIAPLGLILLAGVDPAVAGLPHSPLGWLVLLAAIGALLATGRLQRALRSEVAATT